MLSLTCTEYFREFRLEKIPSVMCYAAASEGHTNLLRWCIWNGHKYGDNICDVAARAGQLETLKWLTENNCPWTHHTCIAAVEGGHLNVLMHLCTLTNMKSTRHRYDLLLPHDICNVAALYGNLHILRWIRFRTTSTEEDRLKYQHLWDERVWHQTLNYFSHTVRVMEREKVEEKCLKIMTSLLDYKCEWNKRIMRRVAAIGSLRIFQLLVTNDCSWNVADCYGDANTEIREWITKHTGYLT